MILSISVRLRVCALLLLRSGNGQVRMFGKLLLETFLLIYLLTYRQWINPYLATYDYLKSIIENKLKYIP